MTVQYVSKLLQTNVALNMQRCVDMHFFQNEFLSMLQKKNHPRKARKRSSETHKQVFTPPKYLYRCRSTAEVMGPYIFRGAETPKIKRILHRSEGKFYWRSGTDSHRATSAILQSSVYDTFW